MFFFLKHAKKHEIECLECFLQYYSNILFLFSSQTIKTMGAKNNLDIVVINIFFVIRFKRTIGIVISSIFGNTRKLFSKCIPQKGGKENDA